MFNTIYTQDIWEHVNTIRGYTYDNYDDFMKKYGPFEASKNFATIERVWWFFAEMGTLVYRGFITLGDCYHLVTSTPLEIWSHFQIAMEGLRVHYFPSGETAYVTFEYLAKLMMHDLSTGNIVTGLDELFGKMPKIDIPPPSELNELVKTLQNKHSNR
jgi:hypothetical protein